MGTFIDPTDPSSPVTTTTLSVLNAASSSGPFPLRIVAVTAVFAAIAFILIRRGAVG